MTTAKRIILDCDPGHDDAVAILLALGDPRIEVLGITTIGGNQTLEKVSRNARVVCTVAGVTDVPVYAGCTRPLVRDVEVAADIHGDTGMEIHSYQLPEPAFDLADGHAVDFIIDTIMSEEPGTVTLVPTGPLTNIAMAARKEPRIVERVQEVVLMGGGYHVGNWSAVAEFNIKVDPEAAYIVFNEKWPVTMVGLDPRTKPWRPLPWRRKSQVSAPTWLISWWACSDISARPIRMRKGSTTRPCTTPVPSPTSLTPPWCRCDARRCPWS